MGRLVLALVLVGCSFRAKQQSDGGTIVDAAVDSSIDAPPDGPACVWSPSLFDPCAYGPPGGDLHLTGPNSPYTYDTTTGGGTLTDKTGTSIPITALQIDQPGIDLPAALLLHASIELDGPVTLFVIGTKPLIIAASSDGGGTGKMEIDGLIDASSHSGNPAQTGAGSNPQGVDASLCQAHAATPGQDAVSTGGSGGGAGGAFGGGGGHGGQGDSPPGPLGGTGGTAVAAPAIIRGGCSASNSGAAGSAASAPSTSTTVSPGGAGGGAVALIAEQSITLKGTLLAGGGGGAGAAMGSANGGGGGGAGGYLRVEAPTVTFVNATVIAANGGGGGGSAPFTNQVPTGNPGSDGLPSATPAPGGAHNSGTTCGVAGAAGGAGTTPAADATANDACGGGGGGGAAGFVFIKATTLTRANAVISPPDQ